MKHINFVKSIKQISCIKSCSSNIFYEVSTISEDIVLATLMSYALHQDLNIKTLIYETKYSAGAIYKNIGSLMDVGYISVQKGVSDKRFSHLKPTKKLIEHYEKFLSCANDCCSHLS